MPCECGHADECDGEYATYYPLQDGGMCSVQKCTKPQPTSLRELGVHWLGGRPYMLTCEPTRSERMRAAGYTRRPSAKSLPSDE